MFTKSLSKKNKGVVSLLAMILMAAITAIAVGSSIIAILELRQSETISQSFVASFAAESGMENGLYTIKTDRTLKSVADTTTELNVSGEQSYSTSTNATWRRTATPSTFSFSTKTLNPDQSVSFDFYDPDNSTGNLNVYPPPNSTCGLVNGNPACVTNLYVSWDDNCNGFSWLETTVTDLSPLFNGTATTTPAIGKATQACDCSGSACNSQNPTNARVQCSPWTLASFNSITSNGAITTIPVDGRPERFSFRPILPLGTSNTTCSIQNLNAEMHDDYWSDWTFQSTSLAQEQFKINHTKPLPAHLTLTVTGSFGKTEQAVTAVVPWRSPVSGLLNFVLFSDQSIIK